MMATPPFHVSSKPTVDWTGFFAAVGNALTEFYAAAEFPSEKRPLYVEEFPATRNGHFDVPFDAIVWKVIHSRLAPTDNAGSRVPNGITLVTRPHPKKTGYQQTLALWRELLTAEFGIYSKSNKAANEIVSWFHRLMMRMAGDKYFKAFGVDYFRFVERLEDAKSSTQDAQDLYIRTLRYEARITLQDTLDLKTLESISLHVGPDFSANLTGD